MKINNKKIKSLIFLSLLNSASGKEDNKSEIAHPKEINLNQLSQIATNLTERQNNPDQTMVFGGYPMLIRDYDNNVVGDCTAGFVIVLGGPTDNCDLVGKGSNLITSARCCKVGDCISLDAFNLKNEVMIGRIDESAYDEDRSEVSSPDYLSIISPYAGDEKVKLVPYVTGEKVFYPVMGLGSVAQWGEVCAYGAFSSYRCGKLVEMELSTGSGRDMTFTGVNKVDLGEGNGFDSERDLGGPVYVTNNIGERTVAQALGYISGIDNSDLNHKIFYYTPLSVVFDYFSKPEQGCYLELITYNETNAQEYDQLLAQVEIPVKK